MRLRPTLALAVGLLCLAPRLVAAPLLSCDSLELRDRALSLVNKLRAEGVPCGSSPSVPAPPLQWSEVAMRAAHLHALDMATNSRLAHAGSDGRSGGDRLTEAGFSWRRWAENLAAGTRSLDEVMRLWAASPTHCVNLMQPQLSQMGLSCVNGHDGRMYWAMSLATPR